jgi:hypothetical protein
MCIKLVLINPYTMMHRNTKIKFVCISWTKKCLILLMHGASVKFIQICHFVCDVRDPL